MNDSKQPLLELQKITKSYPGVIANSDISFSIKAGEIHALLGENGAGKSTLVKMIYGLVKPDSGNMLMNGAVYAPHKPSESRRAGVGMVFQHFSLFEAMTVAENIALGMEQPPQMQSLEHRIVSVSQAYGLPLQPKRIIADLSAGERQRVEIVRCLLQNPRLLIMDEPTSVLTPQEVTTLFTTLRTLSDEGTAILYISHKLNEIRDLCSNATVLRGGKVVGTCDPRVETPKSMAEMMIGMDLSMPKVRDTQLGPVILKSHNLCLPSSNPFGTSLKNIDFELHQGEILGIGGVAGNGQEELLSAFSGEAITESQTLYLKDKDISLLRPNQRRTLGIVSAPEERLGHAAAPTMTLIENALLSGRVRQSLTKWGFIDWGKTERFAKEIIQDFDVRTPNAHVEAKALSGGNLQKFVMGREMLQKPDVIIINQPTWGVDAAAAADIREALKTLAAQGTAIIAISQDLDELMELSDQFAVLTEGQLSSLQATSSLTIDQVGLMMGGQSNTAKDSNHGLNATKVAHV